MKRKAAEQWMTASAVMLGYCNRCGYRPHDGKCPHHDRCYRCDHRAILSADERATVLTSSACSCHDTPRFVFRVELAQ